MTSVLCDFQLWFLFISGLSLLTSFNSAGGATTFNLLQRTPDTDCQPVKSDRLRQRLGRAFNQHYMAMDGEDVLNNAHPLASEDLNHFATRKNITKRSTHVKQTTDPAQWTCETTKVWNDLGPKFFPRRVRSVICSSSTCWFKHFRCRPKHYTIKVLKKKEGLCLRVNSSAGIPRFEDFWELVDHQITVNCECGH